MARYWHVEYTSCESNYRWTVVKTPDEWEEYEVQDAVMRGASMGDDPSEILSIEETFENQYDYGEDYT